MDDLQREELEFRIIINERLEKLETTVEDLDKIVVRGNGKPSLQEDVRTTLKFVYNLQWWMTTIAVTFIAQFVAVSAAMVLTIIRILPILSEIANAYAKNSP